MTDAIQESDILENWMPTGFVTLADAPDVAFQLEFRGPEGDICIHYRTKKKLTKSTWLGACTVLEELAERFGQIFAYPVTPAAARCAGLMGFEDTGKYVYPWSSYSITPEGTLELTDDTIVCPLFVLQGV